MPFTHSRKCTAQHRPLAVFICFSSSKANVYVGMVIQLQIKTLKLLEIWVGHFYTENFQQLPSGDLAYISEIVTHREKK